jgi:beta-glucuronidase
MAVCINKKPTKLLGFSKHAMHPSFGIALPEQQLMQDVQLLRQLSGNYFRLVHYPHNPRLLDICDEMGILLWQETLGWGLGESILTNSTIRQYLLYVFYSSELATYFNSNEFCLGFRRNG